MHVFNWVSLLITNQSNTLLKSYFPLTLVAWNILLTASNYIGFSLIFSEKLSRSRYSFKKFVHNLKFFSYLQKFLFFFSHPIFSTIAVVTIHCTFLFPEVAFILKLDFNFPYFSISKGTGGYNNTNLLFPAIPIFDISLTVFKIKLWIFGRL